MYNNSTSITISDTGTGLTIYPPSLVTDIATITYPKCELLTAEPKKVIFNDPATIVYWDDGTKTVVKCKKGDKFDKWVGYAMAHMKKLYGKDFHRKFKKWCD